MSQNNLARITTACVALERFLRAEFEPYGSLLMLANMKDTRDSHLVINKGETKIRFSNSFISANRIYDPLTGTNRLGHFIKINFNDKKVVAKIRNNDRYFAYNSESKILIDIDAKAFADYLSKPINMTRGELALLGEELIDGYWQINIETLAVPMQMYQLDFKAQTYIKNGKDYPMLPFCVPTRFQDFKLQLPNESLAVSLINSVTKENSNFETITEAAKAIGTTVQSISQVLRGKQKTVKGKSTGAKYFVLPINATMEEKLAHAKRQKAPRKNQSQKSTKKGSVLA